MDLEKTYKYTNSSDEIVEVSQDHIDTAVEIYQELSKNSRSKKVSWRKHRRMMEQEGIDDSDINENYRQLIKNARKRKGLLPSVETHADMLATEKINAIKEEMGAIVSSRLEANDEFTRLSRLKREWTRELLMIEAISEKMNEFDWTGIGASYEDYLIDESVESPVLVALTSDWHYGYDVPQYYTPEKTRELVREFTAKIIKLAHENNVKEIILVDIGDKIEGKLRSQSIMDSKITPVEQMMEATWITIDMIDEMSRYFNVSYFTLFDNHARITPDKNQAIEEESYVTINKEVVKRYAQSQERVTYIEPINNYYHIMNVNGVNMYFCHGHREAVKNTNTLSQLSMNHSVDLDILIHGHYHTFGLVEVGDDKYQFSVGSIKGPDAFSDRITKKSSRSQGAILIYENGEFDIRQVKLI